MARAAGEEVAGEGEHAPASARRPRWFLLLRLVVSAGLFAYIFAYVVDVDELVALLEGIDGSLLILPLCLFAVLYVISAFRWAILLRSQGIEIGSGQAIRLTFLGGFCNTVLPGLTGGDLVKAVAVARNVENRVGAVISVFADRIFAVVALGLLAACVVLLRLDEPRLRGAAAVIYGFLLAAGLGALLYYSRRARRLLRIDALFRRLPGRDLLSRVDQAFFLYRYHKRAVAACMLLSLLGHACNIVAHFLLAGALGYQGGDFLAFVIIVPTVLIICSLPISLQGWGVGEAVYGFFFAPLGLSSTQAATLALVVRLALIFLSLPGGLVLLRNRPRSAGSTAP